MATPACAAGAYSAGLYELKAARSGPARPCLPPHDSMNQVRRQHSGVAVGAAALLNIGRSQLTHFGSDISLCRDAGFLLWSESLAL